MIEIDTIVMLRHDVDRYPHFIAPKGARGVVTDTGDPNIFAVRLDEQLAGAETWDNEVHWILDAGDDPARDIVSICGYCDGPTKTTDWCESCGVDHRWFS